MYMDGRENEDDVGMDGCKYGVWVSRAIEISISFAKVFVIHLKF